MTPHHRILATFGGSLTASFLAGVILLCAVHPAFAQAVTNTVDVAPVLSNVLNTVAMVLTVGAGVLGTFVARFVASKTRVNDAAMEKLMADRVSDILVRAIDYAHTVAAAEVTNPNSQFTKIQFDNWFVAQAAGYAARSMPDLIKYFKLTPDRIADMVRSRLASYIAVPVANSGTLAPAGVTVSADPVTLPVGGA